MRLPYLHLDPIQGEVQKFSLQNNKIEQCFWQGSLVGFNHLLMQDTSELHSCKSSAGSTTRYYHGEGSEIRYTVSVAMVVEVNFFYSISE